MSTLSFLNNPTYISTMSQINKICIQNNIDESHGLPHAIQIAIHINQCVSTETGLSEVDREDIILAALLHDVDDHKYFKTQNFQNANNILTQVLNGDKARIDRILRMILLVSFSKNGNNINPQDPIWYYFPRYADRIQAIGLIGLLRTYQYSERVNTPFYLPSTLRPQTIQQLYTKIQNRDQLYMQRGGRSQSVIDHVLDKLLHIKLPNEIKNQYLEGIYQHGHQYMVDFIMQQSGDGYKNAEGQLLVRVSKMEQQKQLQQQQLKYFLKAVNIQL